MDPWRGWWDYLIIATALYSTIVIPIQIGVNPELLGKWYLIIDIITYILYVADFFIALRTTQVDGYGNEIRDDWLITTNYVKSPGFWIDFFSLWAAPAVDTFSMFGIFKLNRLLRLLSIISGSNLEKGMKSGLSILFYFGLLLIYLHITGCLWFVFVYETYLISDERHAYLESIGRLDKFVGENEAGVPVGISAWIPPYDFYDGSEYFWTRFENGEWGFVYYVCLYYATLIIGGNEMGPKEGKELLFCVGLNLFGALFNSYIFGELAVLLASADTKDNEYQSVLDTANTAMDNIGLSSDTRKSIRTYFKTVQMTMTQQQELSALQGRICESLTAKLRCEMFKKEI